MSSPEMPKSVTVEVFGTPIVVKTNEPEDRIRNIARFVDARMRETAQRAQVISSLKVAIMTSMHIASELPQFGGRASDLEVETRLARLTQVVNEAFSQVHSDVPRQGNEKPWQTS